MTSLGIVLQGLFRQASAAGDASAQLSGGLVIRVTKSISGYRVTLERIKVMPADHEVDTLTKALYALGWAVVQSGKEESGQLVRRWTDIQPRIGRINREKDETTRPLQDHLQTGRLL